MGSDRLCVLPESVFAQQRQRRDGDPSSFSPSPSHEPNTIAFLKSNHFDFNKSFLHGVSMLRRSDEQRILDDISSASKHKAAGDKMEINKNNIKTLKAVFDQV